MASRETFAVNPLATTFRLGKREPFSRWFPYIEGYSADYVNAILATFAREAATVLDPFAGTGTTALVAGALGMRSFFCEINPVLQTVALAKARVLGIDRSRRMELARRLREIGRHSHGLESCPPDAGLHEAYRLTFKGSLFFHPEVYDQVLRMRTWVDRIKAEEPLVGLLLEVSVLANLVPASRLKRAGDLRYKSDVETQQYTPNLVDLVRATLDIMAQDMETVEYSLKEEPVLLVEDARNLDRIPHQGIDTVITSPPYLNGTNYFRNTKIEMWFLRCLQTHHDLRAFRTAAVTAGINDVTSAKKPEIVHPDVLAVVHALEERAYDARIPRMVASYFHDMNEIFRALSVQLVPGATVAVDIGDSIYGGVYVPVHKLLAACVTRLGYDLQAEIKVRPRRSRGGGELHQYLLVFRYQPPKHRKKGVADTGYRPFWQVGWESFQKDLPHRQAPYSSRNWGHARHSLCSFPGKLKPAIAHFLVKYFVPEQGRVLDPFAGVGTILFEAALQGKTAYGFEISPPAYIVAAAKLKRVTLEECMIVIRQLEEFLASYEPSPAEWEEARTFGFNGVISEYFEVRTLREVLGARRFFRLNHPRTPAAMFVMAAVLHILHGNRPYALSRRSHPLTPFKPTGTFEYRPLIELLRGKVMRQLEQPLPERFQEGRMYFHDATTWWPREVEELDAVITSPPFFASTRFYMANWMRLWFAGWSANDFKVKPKAFVDWLQLRSYTVYEPVLRQARERLRKNGVVVLHLGKSHKADMAQELRRIARRWFAHAEVFNESVIHCESHGLRDKGTVSTHQYLLLY